jgi:hypothetical protein
MQNDEPYKKKSSIDPFYMFYKTLAMKSQLKTSISIVQAMLSRP